uniref:Uncharacterized protein n=1 Tax=Amphidinium carterae TaxID=2961 RepID=A7YXG1_AMPCA|nr:unknown [Amphidinium carterae]
MGCILLAHSLSSWLEKDLQGHALVHIELIGRADHLRCDAEDPFQTSVCAQG